MQFENNILLARENCNSNTMRKKIKQTRRKQKMRKIVI